MFRALMTAVCLAGLCPGQSEAQTPVSQARIGVLAYLGYEDALVRWHGLKRYLDATVPSHEFDLVPMTLASASSQIASGQIDFVLTNPGHYVDLAQDHAMSVIATRNLQRSDGTYSAEFGSLIIARAGSGIEELVDARGKTVVAIDKMAFGGFQLAWREFDNAQINLFTDTEALVFVGFPMDGVIKRVATGQADIGIIRSGLMERAISEGSYAKDDFVYLNTNVTYAHPDMISTRLYPEWPFAALANVDPRLRDAVAIALLSAKDNPVAQDMRLRNYWSSPVAYNAAIDLKRAFALRVEQPTLWQRVIGLVPLILVIAAGLGAATALAFRFTRDRSNQMLRSGSSDQTPDKDLPSLTKRERQILDYITQGYSSKEIAQRLEISPKTVEFHRANLLKKFDARSSTQLVALAS
ncbi:PhnD/SsuA/transferrin family substrate-binding protein [uncultured Marivita sp.]|uniref:PhnD/SsuA/transferrin family substrate-binding protein n=1 Tax=uncultured Marivita sp. TaxID=888080 RepID=UPI0026311923|nr:PhnD/SsuA/transferrin family substrate-binding protein [uncultured Marivita sp.]